MVPTQDLGIVIVHVHAKYEHPSINGSKVMAWTDRFRLDGNVCPDNCDLDNWVTTLVPTKNLGIVIVHVHAKFEHPSINGSKVMVWTDRFCPDGNVCPDHCNLDNWVTALVPT